MGVTKVRRLEVGSGSRIGSGSGSGSYKIKNELTKKNTSRTSYLVAITKDTCKKIYTNIIYVITYHIYVKNKENKLGNF